MRFRCIKCDKLMSIEEVIITSPSFQHYWRFLCNECHLKELEDNKINIKKRWWQ